MSEISEKAIKLIKDLRRDISIDIMFTPEKNAEDNSLKALTAYIAELEEKQRWIPVSERLPENGIRVLTSDVTGYISTDFIVELDMSFRTFHLQRKLVTHWMPLPQPPEVQE